MASTPVALGAIKEFDPDVDRITPYLERVALFLTANGVGEDAEVPAFLSIIGGKAYASLGYPDPRFSFFIRAGEKRGSGR